MNINQPQNGNFAPQPYQMPYDRQPKIRPTASFSTYDLIFAAIFLITAILSFNFSCFGGFNLGFSISGVILSAYAIIYNAQKNFSLIGTFFALCGAVLSATCFIFVEALKIFCVLFFWAFEGLAFYFCSKCGKAKTEKGMIFETLQFIIVAPFKHLSLMFNSMSDAAKEKDKAKTFTPILIGVVCAIPALIIIVPLLISGDAAFEGLVNKSLFANFGELICSVIFGSAIAIFGFSAIFAAKKDKCFKEKAAKEKGGIPLSAVNGFLGAVSAVYLLYIFSQIDYFAGGLMGFLPKAYQVADYARRGFFEMSVICVFNLVFILLANNFSKRQKGAGLTLLKIFSVFICAFSLFLICSVVAKLFLYMKSFAITRLRVLTTVFCIMLAVAFICLIIKLFAKKFPYFRITAITVAIIMLAVCCTGFDGFIAKYNYTVYKSGIQEKIDVTYLSTLGKSSVPYLIKLLDSKDEAVVTDAVNALVAQYADYGENDSAAGAIMYIDGYIPKEYDEDIESEEIYKIDFPQITSETFIPTLSGDLKPIKQGDFRGFNI
ncbi:MAG: DUF4173 domain-containing protein, partial [Oscillospiraceae bacterium]|nr:DUF4173 domain-containing protein [Candidatus Equicaccousia limihippi]